MIIDGQEYEEISYKEFENLPDKEIAIFTNEKDETFHLKIIKSKPKFPVRVKFERGYYAKICSNGKILNYCSDGSNCHVLEKPELKILMEKYKELEEFFE